MSKWCFKRIDLERMPGCDRFTFNELNSGINIISGPNASGKSTTARAISDLLWPSRALPYEEASASFDLEDAEWYAGVRNRCGTYRGNGTQTPEAPHSVPADRRSAYLLSLPDLIQSTDTDFAQVIRREAAGGYDIDACAAALKYKIADQRHSANLKENLTTKAKNVSDVGSTQTELSKREAEIDELRAERDAAAEAANQAYILAEAEDYSVKLRSHQEADEALARFDVRMANLLPNDAQTLQGLKENRATVAARRARAASEFRDARTRLTEADLPNRMEEAALDKLNMWQNEWRSREIELQQREEELVGFEGEQAAALRNISAEIDAERLKEIARDPDGAKLAGELLQFGRDVAKWDADNAAQKAVSEWVGDVDASAPLADVQTALSYLLKWLSSPAAPVAHALNPWLALICGIFIGLGLALVTVSPAFLALSGIAVVVVIAAKLSSKPSASADERESIRRYVLQMSVPGPAEWTEELVNQRVAELHHLAADLAKAEYWRSLEPKRQELAERKQQLDQRARDLLKSFGIAPESENLTMTVLAETISRWLEAGEKVEGKRSACEMLRSQIEGCRNMVNSVLVENRCAEVEDSGTAAAAIQRLGARKSAYDTALTDINRAVADLREARMGIARADNERRAFYKRIGANMDDEQTLMTLISDFDAYSNASDTQRNTRAVLDASEKRLVDEITKLIDSAQGWYEKCNSKADAEAEEIAAHLKTIPAPELSSQLIDLRARASKLEEINNRIIETETDIKRQRAGHDLERALAEFEETRDTAREDRSRAYSAAAGSVLCNFVKRETQKSSLPEVFKRANEFFSEFTGYKYRLDFDYDKVQFSAVDTVRNAPQALEELSVGTRVQLLLAVRMAFVEQQEQGVKLPIILDETLATSDPERAQKIIQAVARISSNGRQVFYFTAQQHEVQIWKYHLSEMGLEEGRDYLCADLTEIRMLAGPRVELPDINIQKTSIPEPAKDMSHEDYGRLLGVTGVDFSSESIDSVHIWHMIEDDDTLYRLITEESISVWGQLKTAYETRIHKPLSEDQWRQAQAAAKVLEEASSLWMQGRDKPFDREMLEESGAIRPAFWDRAVEAVDECRGDARRVLKAIGEIPRFQTRLLDQLESFLRGLGCIDDEPQLTSDEIITGVLNLLDPEITSGSITREQVMRVLRRCPELNTASH